MTIKLRLTLATIVVFVVGVCGLSLDAMRLLRAELEQQVGNQQSSAAAFVAAYVESELAARIGVLQRIAEELPQGAVRRKDAFQGLLAARYDEWGVFSGGIALSAYDGRIVAEAPKVSGRVGRRFLELEHIHEALETGRTSVGVTKNDRVVGSPIVGIALPIRDERGQVVGALSGITELGVSGFMREVLGARYGETGGYLLVSPQAQMVIAASDPARVLEPLPEKGRIPLIDRFAEGYEGAGVLTNLKGVEELVAAKRVPTAGWYVVALQTSAEAFAPIREVQQRMLLASLAMVLAIGLAIRWVLSRVFAPLSETTTLITAMSSSEGNLRPLGENRQDEIGALVNSFNRLVRKIQSREHELEKSEAKFRSLFERNTCPMLLIDPLRGRFVGANEAAVAFYGYPKEQLVGMSTSDVLSLSPEDVFNEGVRAVRLESDAYYYVHRLASGELRHVEVHLTPIEEDGRIVLFSIIHDITPRRRAEEELVRLAQTDLLTGVFSRRHFLASGEREWARLARYGGCLSCFMIDVDYFKRINDTHGHRAGDLVLERLGEVFKATLREIDVIGRMGGEEFAVILPETEEGAALLVAERLRRAVETTGVAMEQGAPLSVTMSIGVATVCNAAEINLEALLGQADRALYSAKRGGRNRVVLFTPPDLAS